MFLRNMVSYPSSLYDPRIQISPGNRNGNSINNPRSSFAFKLVIWVAILTMPTSAGRIQYDLDSTTTGYTPTANTPRTWSKCFDGSTVISLLPSRPKILTSPLLVPFKKYFIYAEHNTAISTYTKFHAHSFTENNASASHSSFSCEQYQDSTFTDRYFMYGNAAEYSFKKGTAGDTFALSDISPSGFIAGNDIICLIPCSTTMLDFKEFIIATSNNNQVSITQDDSGADVFVIPNAAGIYTFTISMTMTAPNIYPQDKQFKVQLCGNEVITPTSDPKKHVISLDYDSTIDLTTIKTSWLTIACPTSDCNPCETSPLLFKGNAYFSDDACTTAFNRLFVYADAYDSVANNQRVLFKSSYFKSASFAVDTLHHQSLHLMTEWGLKTLCLKMDLVLCDARIFSKDAAFVSENIVNINQGYSFPLSLGFVCNAQHCACTHTKSIKTNNGLGTDQLSLSGDYTTINVNIRTNGIYNIVLSANPNPVSFFPYNVSMTFKVCGGESYSFKTVGSSSNPLIRMQPKSTNEYTINLSDISPMITSSSSHCEAKSIGVIGLDPNKTVIDQVTTKLTFTSDAKDLLIQVSVYKQNGAHAIDFYIKINYIYCLGPDIVQQTTIPDHFYQKLASNIFINTAELFTNWVVGCYTNTAATCTNGQILTYDTVNDNRFTVDTSNTGNFSCRIEFTHQVSNNIIVLDPLPIEICDEQLTKVATDPQIYNMKPIQSFPHLIPFITWITSGCRFKQKVLTFEDGTDSSQAGYKLDPGALNPVVENVQIDSQIVGNKRLKLTLTTILGGSQSIILSLIRCGNETFNPTTPLNKYVPYSLTDTTTIDLTTIFSTNDPTCGVDWATATISLTTPAQETAVMLITGSSATALQTTGLQHSYTITVKSTGEVSGSVVINYSVCGSPSTTFTESTSLPFANTYMFSVSDPIQIDITSVITPQFSSTCPVTSWTIYYGETKDENTGLAQMASNTLIMTKDYSKLSSPYSIRLWVKAHVEMGTQKVTSPQFKDLGVVQLCGMEQMTETLGGKQVFPKANINAEQTWTILSKLDYPLAANCPIQQFFMSSSSTQIASATFTGFSIVSGQVSLSEKFKVDQNTPFTTSFFLIVKTQFKETPLALTFKVCGAETITTTTSTTIVTKGYHATNTVTTDLIQFFTSTDADCRVDWNTLTLVLGGTNDPSGTANQVTLSGKDAVGKLDTVVKQSYTVIVSTIGQVSNSITLWHIICGKSPSDMSVTNAQQSFKFKDTVGAFYDFNLATAITTIFTFCPITSFHYYLNNDAYTGPVVAIDVANKLLKISQDKANVASPYSFTVQYEAAMVYDANDVRSAKGELSIQICGMQTMQTSWPSQIVVPAQPTQQTLTWTIFEKITNSLPNNCPILSFALCTSHSNGQCITPYSGTKLAISADTVEAQKIQATITTPSVETVYVQINSDFKKDFAQLTVKACGSETVSTTTPTDVIRGYHATNTVTTDLKQFFSSSDPDCPVEWNTLTLVLGGTNDPTGTADQVTLQGTDAIGKLDTVVRQLYTVQVKTTGGITGQVSLWHTVCGKDSTDMVLQALPSQSDMQKDQAATYTSAPMSMFIQSSHTFCKITGYHLYMNSIEYTGNIVKVDATDPTNVQLKTTQDKALLSFPYNFKFQIEAAMVYDGGDVRSGRIELTRQICGMETIVANWQAKVYLAGSALDQTLDWTIVSKINNTMDGYCPITMINLCSTAAGNQCTAYTGPDIKLSSDQSYFQKKIVVNSNLPIEKTVYIQVDTNYQVSVNFLPLTIKVCSGETISVNDPQNEVLKMVDMGPDAIVVDQDLSQLFTISNPSCPIIEYQLTQLPGKTENLSKLSVLTNQMKVSPQVPFEAQFLVKAITVENLTAEKKYHVLICGQEELVELQANKEFLLTHLSTSTVLKLSNYIMTNHLLCPVGRYEISTPKDDMILLTQGDLNKPETWNLTFKTDKLYQKTFQLKGITSMKQMSLSFKVTVCGSETINIQNEVKPILIYMQENPYVIDLASIFVSTIPFCSLSNYSAFQVDNKTSETTPLNNTSIVFDQKQFKILTTKVIYERFMIRVQSIGNMTKDHMFNVTVECGIPKDVSVDIQLVNIELAESSTLMRTFNYLPKIDNPNCWLYKQEVYLVDNNEKRVTVDKEQMEVIYPSNSTNRTEVKIGNMKEIGVYKIKADFVTYNLSKTVTLADVKVSPKTIKKPSFLSPIPLISLYYDKSFFLTLPQSINPNSLSLSDMPTVTIAPEQEIPDFIQFSLFKNSGTLKIVPTTKAKVRTYTVNLMLSAPFPKLKIIVDDLVPVTIEIRDYPEVTEQKNKTSNNLEAEKQTKNDTASESGTEGKNEESAEERLRKQKEKAAQEELEKKNKEMLKQGFATNSKIGGPSFPGINPQAIDDALKKLQDKNKDKEVIPPLSMEIQQVTTNGTIIMSFNQPTLAPETIDNNIYQHVFDFWVESFLNNTRYYGAIRTTNHRRNLLEAEQTQPFFFVDVLEHSELQLVMNINFTDKEAVSKGQVRDNMIIKVRQPSVFKSKLSLLAMANDAFSNSNQELIMNIPPQIDPATAEKLDSMTDTGSTTATFLGSSNFIVTLIMNASMQTLFGMIRTLQSIVFQCLILVPLPPHALQFIMGCMTIAQIDIFDGAAIIESVLTFQDSFPLNSNYSLLGIETLIFLLNTGSFFVFVFGIIGNYVFVKVANKLCTLRPHNIWFRKAGIYFRGIRSDVPAALNKLVLETYIDMALATFLLFMAFTYSVEDQFSEFAETLSSLLGIANLFVIVGTLGSICYYTRKYFNMKLLRKKVLPEFLWVYYDAISLKTLGQANYNFFYLTRRFLTAMILVRMQNYPFFQCVLLLMLSLANLAYLIQMKPLISSLENKIELINEFTVWATSHMLTNFLNIAVPADLTFNLGWIFIGVIGLNILFNLGVVGQQSVKLIFEERKMKKRQKEIDKQIEKVKEAKDTLIKACPGKYSEFEYEQAYLQALEYCQEWNPHRKWLIENGISLEGFAEEDQYQLYLRKFKFFETRRREKLSAAIEKASQIALKQRRVSVKAISKTVQNEEDEDYDPAIIDEMLDASQLYKLQKLSNNKKIKDFQHQLVVKITQGIQKLAMTQEEAFRQGVPMETINLILRHGQPMGSEEFNFKEESESSSDVEEAAKDVLDYLDRDGEKLYQEYLENSGLKIMIHGGKTGLLSSVMQCLISFEPLVKFLLVDLEEESKVKNNNKLIKKLRQIIINNINTKAIKHQENSRLVNLAGLFKLMPRKADPHSLLDNLTGKLFEEAASDNLKVAEAGKLLKLVHSIQGTCPNGHQVDLHEFQTPLVVPWKKSVQRAVNSVFGWQKLDCKECQLKVNVFTKVQFLPELLIITFSRPDPVKTKVNMKLSLLKWLSPNAGPNYTYELIGAVAQNKEKKVFNAFTLRNGKWVRFTIKTKPKEVERIGRKLESLEVAVLMYRKIIGDTALGKVEEETAEHEAETQTLTNQTNQNNEVQSEQTNEEAKEEDDIDQATDSDHSLRLPPLKKPTVWNQNEPNESIALQSEKESLSSRKHDFTSVISSDKNSRQGRLKH